MHLFSPGEEPNKNSDWHIPPRRNEGTQDDSRGKWVRSEVQFIRGVGKRLHRHCALDLCFHTNYYQLRNFPEATELFIAVESIQEEQSCVRHREVFSKIATKLASFSVAVNLINVCIFASELH